ncbi:hypothetical protein RFI_28674 [Reticulomyxa filosa]|uniref:Dynein light intermediate chain n=1 Tax=Reticulomyxa filosa TaxID=46433 RepID=X6M5G6_RETFI|nr:hypothetical protein RFI_28674 [Reticulomyxa filosa]|eukprot:ETO08712.1 hypothetical protein RFI_28674 [Reticulomyxa filosa]
MDQSAILSNFQPIQSNGNLWEFFLNQASGQKRHEGHLIILGNANSGKTELVSAMRHIESKVGETKKSLMMKYSYLHMSDLSFDGRIFYFIIIIIFFFLLPCVHKRIQRSIRFQKKVLLLLCRVYFVFKWKHMKLTTKNMTIASNKMLNVWQVTSIEHCAVLKEVIPKDEMDRLAWMIVLDCSRLHLIKEEFDKWIQVVVETQKLLLARCDTKTQEDLKDKSFALLLKEIIRTFCAYFFKQQKKNKKKNKKINSHHKRNK